jgi:HK97 family phage major capsid protein
MLNTNELKKQKAERKAAAEKIIKAAVDAGREMTAPETTEYDGHVAECTRITNALQRHADLAQFVSDDTNNHDAPIVRARGEGSEEVEAGPLAILATKEYRKGFWAAMRRGEEAGRKMFAALNITTPGQGGYGVAVEFDTKIVEKLVNVNVMRQIADVFQTTSDRNILVENAIGSASWTAEAAVAHNDDGSDDDSFVQKTLKSNKLTRIEKVSEELLLDNFFDLEGWLARKFGNAFGITEESAFVNGTGSGQPLGVVRSASAGTVSHLHNDIATDEIFDFFHSLKRAYRANGSFLMNDSTLLLLRKKKDGQGRYIYQDGLQNGQPATLLGKPVYISDAMPTADNAGNKAILFGDFKYYSIGDRAPRTFVRLNELYIGNGQVGFRGVERTDGLLTNSEAVVYLAMGAAS